MSKATKTIATLSAFNSWRRGDETIKQLDPSEIGAAIDDAVNLLRRYVAALEEIQHAGSAEWSRKRAKRALEGKT
jgi:hypothetical protein